MRFLRQSASELAADLAKGTIDAARKTLHSSYGCKRDQRSDQGVFDQILTGFILV
jgi:hypothetical protein